MQKANSRLEYVPNYIIGAATSSFENPHAHPAVLAFRMDNDDPNDNPLTEVFSPTQEKPKHPLVVVKGHGVGRVFEFKLHYPLDHQEVAVFAKKEGNTCFLDPLEIRKYGYTPSPTYTVARFCLDKKKLLLLKQACLKDMIEAKIMEESAARSWGYNPRLLQGIDLGYSLNDCFGKPTRKAQLQIC